MPTRFKFIDHLRGLTVIYMIIFHLTFDLDYFGFIQVDFFKDFIWFNFPRLIVFQFLFCVGMGLCLSHIPKIRWKSFGKRLGIISCAAITISIITYHLFPGQWIYFGTLHCIVVSSILALPFLNYPRISLIIALSLIVPSGLFDIDLPWFKLPTPSMDYIPPFPWLGCVLIGIFAFHHNVHKLPSEKIIKNRWPEFLGQHSLLIYLIHQPILFALVWLLRQFIPMG